MTYPEHDDFWTGLDLRMRHALRGRDDRFDPEQPPDWVVVPYGSDGSVRVLPVRDPLAFVDAIEHWVVGEVRADE